MKVGVLPDKTSFKFEILLAFVLSFMIKLNLVSLIMPCVLNSVGINHVLVGGLRCSSYMLMKIIQVPIFLCKTLLYLERKNYIACLGSW